MFATRFGTFIQCGRIDDTAESLRHLLLLTPTIAFGKCVAEGRTWPLARPTFITRVDCAPMMQKLALPIILGVLTMYSVACGAKVVVDSPGSGGAGGDGQGGTGLSTSNSTSASSSSSGDPSPCDQTTSCEKCVSCTVGTVCAEQWAKCASVQPCMDLMYCLASCQNEQGCIEKCQAVYPDGLDIYNETAQCVVCQACINDCNGLSKGCL
jgi:hypothetical protein